MSGRCGRSSRSSRDARDAGQVSLAVLGVFLVVTALVLVATAATRLHLAREQLLALADASSLEASAALDEAAYYGGGASPEAGLPLSAAAVRASAQERLARTPAAPGLLDVVVAEPTGSPDGRTAEVTLAAGVRPAGLPVWLGGGVTVPVVVTSRARAGLVVP